jgi:ELWxxDGT repeat protein
LHEAARMHPKPTSRLRPLSSLLFTLALGCSGMPEEQESAETLVSEAQALRKPAANALPPGLAPSLVKDIQVGRDMNLGSAYTGSRQGTMTIPITTGSTVYFTAYEESAGTELWRTDGTPEGTRLVRDLTPGLDSSNLYDTAVLGDTLYFVAQEYGVNFLWKSDGTPEGTIKVTTPQGTVRNVNELVTCGGKLFFHGMGTEKTRLWAMDGTSKEPVLLTSSASFAHRNLQDASQLVCADGTLFFVNTIQVPAPPWMGPVTDGELWKSDGTPTGTVRVKSLGSVGWPSYLDTMLAAVGSRVFINTFNHHWQPLWTSDGTPEGTRPLTNIGGQAGNGSPSLMMPLGGRLAFTIKSWRTGIQLWTTDGTTVGTQPLARVSTTLNPPLASLPLGDTLLFSQGPGLYKSDGTAQGTVLLNSSVKLYAPWPGDCGEGARLPNGRLLFSAEQSSTRLLWVSDGSTTGTTPLQTLQGQTLREPTGFTHLGDRVLFWANEGVHGMEPWVTDGTPEGTRLVRDIYRADSSSPRQLTDVDGTLFFTAYDGVNRRKLWKTDGTAEGTALVKQLGPSSGNEPTQLTRLGSTLFFYSGVNSVELWKSDGTAEGTVRVHDFLNGTDAYWNRLTAVGSTLFLNPHDTARGRELWKSDGTPEGTVLVKDIYPGSGSSWVDKLTAVGDVLFFIAHDGLHGYELWKSDGTSEGTVLVKDINPGSSSSLGHFDFREMRAVGGTLFFTANDGVHGSELWKTDGTSKGTVLVKDIHPGSASPNISDMAEVEGLLYFIAEDGVHGRELWKTDGTSEGTVMVKDLVAGTGSPFPAASPFAARAPLLHGIGDTLYFAANDGVHGTEPWKSDGTAEGTVLLRDVMPGPYGSGVELAPFVAVGPHGGVAFSASNGVNGLELWMTDGTPEGTRMHSDVAGGAMSASPLLLTVSGPRLFFVADEGVHGRELWSVKHTAFKSR